jgi:hypothetical protein
VVGGLERRECESGGWRSAVEMGEVVVCCGLLVVGV